MNIPLMNLKRQYESIKPEVDAAIMSVLEQGAYIMGSDVSEFEKEYSEYCNSKFAVSVGNGTDAISIALKALNVAPGDHVFIPANTFFATAEAVINIGAVPVLVDVDSKHLLIDCDKLEEAIKKKIADGATLKAIIPVHLYGNMCAMDRIQAIAQKYSLAIVEDAAQSHGATFNGKPVGHYSDAACFSFYPGKNLGAYGDAGAIITNNEDIATHCQKIRNHGRKVGAKYDHDAIGYNSRMDTIQAAVLRIKLRYLQEWTHKRQTNAHQYYELLQNVGDLEFVPVTPNAEHVFHLFVVKSKKRDQLLAHLKENNIFCGIHYPISLSKLSAMKPYCGIESYAVSERSSTEILSLPLCPDLTQEEISFVCSRIKDFFK